MTYSQFIHNLLHSNCDMETLESETKMSVQPDGDTMEDSRDQVEDHPDWVEGDFTLVSSDNVRFCIQSCHVLSAVSCFVLMWTRYHNSLLSLQSHMFRTAGRLATTGDSTIEFTDTVLETATVINNFLRTISTGNGLYYTYPVTQDDCGWLKEWIGIGHAINLVGFLSKWECEAQLSSMRLQARYLRSEASECNSHYFFILGALLDDPGLCFQALESFDIWDDGDDGNEGEFGGRVGCAMIDPTALPFWAWSILPSNYLWALTRSWGHVKTSRRSKHEVETVEDTFLRLMKAIKGMSPWNAGRH